MLRFLHANVQGLGHLFKSVDTRHEPQFYSIKKHRELHVGRVMCVAPGTQQPRGERAVPTFLMATITVSIQDLSGPWGRGKGVGNSTPGTGLHSQSLPFRLLLTEEWPDRPGS